LKKIISFLKEYLTHELKPWFLVSVMLFIGGYVFIEYRFDLTESFQIKYHNTYLYIFIQCLIYLIPFTIGYLIYSFFYNDWSLWGKPLFWFLLLFAPLVFSLRSFVNYFSNDIYPLLPLGRTAYFYYRCTAVIIRDMVIALPIFIYWLAMDKNKMPFYGFTLKNYDTKPYLIMLAIMLPLVVLASYQSDFLSQYPKGFSLEPLNIDNSGDQKYFFIYELFYGFDFIFIEFFFRGFLLLAFYRHFGWGCLLPMACFYVSIHFGKPLGETISSFFGGTIIGILAIRTGSIAGGIIVHLGVAWLMEFTALLHKVL
jgi:membrane protease YdiL (CAAX protease family)